ncbi:hypothetical protein AVEN_57286-1 [Araneus ventricosus]|uniref:Uncharacterized protein n=1 Tax=Araneus ventricosus TaxID=182803 RepID=A0A4Y2K0H5_ARAVE|nr:hypothetical protein AVEN_57286-1 [Araneus ventricosus]
MMQGSHERQAHLPGIGTVVWDKILVQDSSSPLRLSCVNIALGRGSVVCNKILAHDSPFLLQMNLCKYRTFCSSIHNAGQPRTTSTPALEKQCRVGQNPVTRFSIASVNLGESVCE